MFFANLVEKRFFLSIEAGYPPVWKIPKQSFTRLFLFDGRDLLVDTSWFVFFLSVIIATDNTFFYVKILLSSSITRNWLYLIIYTDTKRHYVSFSRRTASRLVSSKRACKYNHSETLLMRKLLERQIPQRPQKDTTMTESYFSLFRRV